MARWSCDLCGGIFFRKTKNKAKARFCSQPCYRRWKIDNGITSGQFKTGTTPWNLGTKGVMKVNRGSFRAGRESDTKQPVGTVTVRTDKAGRSRAWVKVGEGGNSYDWKLRAVFNWEKENGPIPAGLIVHHKDRNTLNDRLSNLKLMDRAGHLLEHRSENEEKRRNAASQAAKRRHASARAKRGTVSEPTRTPTQLL